MQDLGLRRRPWAVVRHELKPVRLGTSLIYDRRDLHALFDRLKAALEVGAEGEVGRRNGERVRSAAALR
jgi:hypothetical protein